VLGRPAGDGNDFHDNEFETGRPPSIESDASSGSEAVTDVLAELEAQVESGDFTAGDGQDQPTPGDQPGMSDPAAPPRPADVASSWEAPQPQTEVYRW